MPPRASSFDPYRTYKFRVRFNQAVVAGVTKVGALSCSVAANEIKQAGDQMGARYSPGMLSYDDVTLEQGWSADAAFESWANRVTRLHDDPAGARGFRRTVHIDVYDLASQAAGGKPVTSFRLHRCWVSRFVAMPELSADAGGIGIRSITLKHEGFERV